MPTYPFDTIQTGNATFPKVLLEEQGSTPTTPDAGKQNLYTRSSDGHLVRQDDTGTVHDLETGGASIALDDLTDVDAPSPSDGDVLTFQTASPAGWIAAPAAGGGGGGYVLIEQHTTAGAASIDFTGFISSTYDTYIFQLINVGLASSGHLLLRFGTGGGPTWDSGNNYQWGGAQWNQGAGGASFGGATVSEIRISTSESNTSTLGFSGEIRLYDPQSTAKVKYITVDGSYHDNTPNFYRLVYGGNWTVSGTAATGIQFLSNSGNISGTIRVYGLAK